MSGPIVLALRLVLALALYAFLGWALLTIWRDLQRAGSQLATRKAPTISLAVRVGRATSSLRHFAQTEITVGRDPTCDIPLLDKTVSARHARLAYHHGQWWVEDLGSTNGTRLNRALLIMPTVVTSGDEIACGKTRLTVNLGADALAPTTKLP